MNPGHGVGRSPLGGNTGSLRSRRGPGAKTYKRYPRGPLARSSGVGKGSALTRSGRRISVLAARAQRARTDRAFERLYSRYVQVVYRYALGVLRNPADAEDVTQTTFMNAFRAFRRGERPRAPERWLIKIAHNACRQRYRELARRPEEVPLSSEVLERLASSEEQRAGVAELLQALGGLSFDQRAALLMHELEGRSYAEIGRASCRERV